MSKINIAINGFGRIGRAFFRLSQKYDDLNIVAINDIGDIENIAYLLKYDTVYALPDSKIQAKSGLLHVDGKEILFISERDPSKLPWKKLNIDVVVESTGVFASYEKSKAHLDAGARRVVITAPVKNDPPAGLSGETVLMGINEDKLAKCDISSNASCTTNAGSPIIAILHEKLGIEAALLNTIHGYTSTQSLVDSPSKKDVRRGRAAAANIVPSTTGAAVSTTKAVTALIGKFDGVATRVPVILGSLADITFTSSRETDAEEVNSILKNASKDIRWKGIFTITEEPIVSSDIIGNTHASIADLSFTKVVGGKLVKVLTWYDNEVGYANTLVKHVIASAKYL
jgi:glyceraldehyde 3-phosphate dehydrogenase